MRKPPEARAAANEAPGLSESPFKGKTGLVRIVHAFFNSCAGLADAWRHESAFRQEILLAAVLIPAAFIAPVTTVERALLIATVLLVIVVELLNTGVEVAIDRISFD
ncbi:MAG: diacylglycerol kinase, partial [Usitatibacter sp.]